MDSLKFESNSGKQMVLSLLSIVVGIILVVGFWHFDGVGRTNSLAGFLLGVFLLLIGISAFLVRGRQTIIVDLGRRHIVVEETNKLRSKKRLIPFNEIVGTGIGYLGTKSNFVTFYYINLKLKYGEEYPLFSPGRFFDGGSDRSAMESRRQRLEEYIKQCDGKLIMNERGHM
ncbi:hypothetical protein C4544_06080 [candidate division WS5 bacterium]|uniref:Uncharacterized protein n=1 Tax=candidate division WS5 bacterium TaxID=2093353 RepID=A0A419DAR1_9BACT|nr:MAG: hypothetical protein C4544_06080 [candidate division WS5 bacterium]